MGSDMHLVARSDYTDIQIHIGEEVPKIEKSALGCCFSLGPSMISWFSRKHTSIAFSMEAAKYIATCSTCSEEVWIRNMLA